MTPRSLAAPALLVPTLALVFLLPAAPAGAAQASEVLVGQLDVVWGDPPPDSGLPARTVLTLTDDDGRRTELAISDELAAAHGGFLAWNRRRVRVHVAAPGEEDLRGFRPGTRRALALTLLDDPRGAGDEVAGSTVSGSQPWVSILCKFSDVAAEPENLAFFQGMYANTFGGLDDYWREQSYDEIDIVGSTAVDWVDLPQPQTSYVTKPGSNSDADLDALFDDCTAAADPFVDFSNGGTGGYSGINQMFNALLDCCAWGGSRFETLDGVTKSWRVTWEPPWGYADEGVIAHEMGHGFGLPHSNNFDGDSNPYDSPWDVMSAATGYSVSDPTYGRLGKHHTAYHKNLLGWFDPGEVLTVDAGTQVTATIDAMALASTTNYRMARIPIPGTNDWYTVEVRDFLGYDGNVPGNVVIISHVDTARSEDAWAVDVDDPPADYGDNEGTMFRVGETFVDVVSDISISIDAATADGFSVTISVLFDDAEIFSDDFESGTAASWSSAR